MHFQPTHDGHQPRLPKTTIFAIIALCCCCWLLSAPHANPKQTSFGIKDEDKYMKYNFCKTLQVCVS